VLVSGSHETAIEVETTAKPLDQYLAILDAYADQGVASHWYVTPPVAQERIQRAAEVLTCATWCGSGTGHRSQPGATERLPRGPATRTR
jgi:hypothetical protein